MVREAPYSAKASSLALVLLLAAVAGAFVAAPSNAKATFAKIVMPIHGARLGAGAMASSSNNLVYHGGAIQQAPKVYLVFWGWHGLDPSGEAPDLIAFFSGIGGSAWANIQTQYYEQSGSYVTNPTGQLAGVWYDDETPATGGYAVVPDAFLGNEALRAEAHFGYNADANYIIATPHLQNDAQFGVSYCAWHSAESDGNGNVIAYTDLPYMTDGGTSCGQNFVNSGSAGTLDGVTMVAGHEYAETVTDPHPNSGWIDANGGETGDKCAWIAPGSSSGAANLTLSTGSFAVQGLWSNDNVNCVRTYTYTAMNACFFISQSSLAVTVDATCSRDSLGTIRSYTWSWGDGSPAGSAVSATHTYAVGGTYNLTLTIADSGGSTASESQAVRLSLQHPETYTGTVLVGGQDTAVYGCGVSLPCPPLHNGYTAAYVTFDQDVSGMPFLLHGTSVVNTGNGLAPDFDIFYYDCAGNQIGAFTAQGDDSGIAPVGSCSAWVELSLGVEASYTLSFT
ncbi:MAG: PKD domain-containing protein [Thermoplasmatota archaeon]